MSCGEQDALPHGGGAGTIPVEFSFLTISSGRMAWRSNLSVTTALILGEVAQLASFSQAGVDARGP